MIELKMQSHAVITGGTGFIGRAIVREWLARGGRVTVLMREESDASCYSNFDVITKVTYKRLCSRETIAAIADQSPDVFIHCAWRGVSGRDRNEPFQVTENLPLTVEAAELAHAVGCRQWIGLGSQAEYGNQNRRLAEDVPACPTTLYGKSKWAAGIATLGLCEAYGMIGTWLRVFSIYGPGDAPNWFIPYVTQEFFSGRKPRLTHCEQLWDYLHVQDAARGVVAAAEKSASGVFNLGSGTSRPLREIVEMIRQEMKCGTTPEYGAISYRPDQIMHLEANISKICSITGWKPTVDFRVGLAETIETELKRS